MLKEKEVKKVKVSPSRSSMQVTLITRLLGMTATIFVLILTVKSELLEFKIVAWQLIISMPLLFLAIVSNSKIVDEESFQKYRKFNLVINTVAMVLVLNTIGLLASRYISAALGTIYFLILIAGYGYLFSKDWKDKKVFNETIAIIMIIVLGLIPALMILT